jgi:hypothetical protein
MAFFLLLSIVEHKNDEIKPIIELYSYFLNSFPSIALNHQLFERYRHK